jgi:hypothetical protein
MHAALKYFYFNTLSCANVEIFVMMIYFQYINLFSERKRKRSGQVEANKGKIIEGIGLDGKQVQSMISDGKNIIGSLKMRISFGAL